MTTTGKPEIDLSACKDCEVCVSLCPRVFRKNPATGLLEVADLDAYPAEELEEARRLCPAQCITLAEA